MIWLHPLLLIVSAIPTGSHTVAWVLPLLECAVCLAQLLITSPVPDDSVAEP